MKRVGGLSAVMLLCAVGTGLAQQPAPRPMGQDTPPEPGMMRPPFRPEMQDRERMMRFQQQIEERFGRMVQVELNLNDQQMDRLRTAMRGNQDRHQDLNRREQDLHRAMADQLQPGVAANQDSLGRMLDAALQTRVSHVQSDQQFNRDLAQFLTPVQRARLVIMMKRFEERVGEIRGRMQGPMPGQPGPMPMMRRQRQRPAPGPEEL